MRTLAFLSKRTRRIAAVAALLMLVASAAVGGVASGNLNLSSLAGTAASSTCTVGASGTTYTTIQAAVNDAGCATINVAAGTYNENIVIQRDVTINGAGAATTIVDGGYGTRYFTCPTSNCSVFKVDVAALHVIFNALTIKSGYDYGNRGGGIDIYSAYDAADVTIQSSVVMNDTAGGFQGGGGVKYKGYGTLNVVSSTFTDNAAAAGGAIYMAGGGTLSMRNSTVSNRRSGGGVFLDENTSATIINSTFTNIIYGSALEAYPNARTIKVSNSTFSDNLGAIRVGHLVNASLKSTIIANSPSGWNCDGTFTDLGNNLRWPSTDTSCVGTFGDPKLAALANNGGSTQTMLPQAGSAAIDRGSCSDADNQPVPSDQRGYYRPFGITCDIGAVEVGSPGVSTPTPIPTPTQTPVPPTPAPVNGPIHYWKFDEGSGTMAYDFSGFRPGMLVNGANYMSGPLPALRFSNRYAVNLAGGQRKSHVEIDGINIANGSFTVAGWALRASTAGKQWLVVQGSNQTDRALVMGFRDNDRFTCAFYSDDLDTTSQYLDVGQWHHWACTFDAATRARKLYRDGVLVASDTSKAVPQTGTGTFYLGASPWNLGEGYFDGAIDDWRIYNRPLTAAEVQWLAQGNP